MLTKLTEQVYVLPGGVNIGVVRLDDRSVALIDSGLNESAARKALRASREELGSDIVAIVTTHGHADHFGGNAFLLKRTQAETYAPVVEEVMLRYPILQPSLLYGGADPLDSMRTEFLLAEASPVNHVYESGPFEVNGVALEAVHLAGHSINQQGVLVDSVLFCADVLTPPAVIEKYRVPYLFSLTDHLSALETMRGSQAWFSVPGHGPVMESINTALAANEMIVEQTQALIIEATAEPATLGDISMQVMNRLGANPTDAVGYYLLQPTIAAYLTHLTRTGMLAHQITANQSVWQRA